jgi:hypothetical protein
MLPSRGIVRPFRFRRSIVIVQLVGTLVADLDAGETAWILECGREVKRNEPVRAGLVGNCVEPVIQRPQELTHLLITALATKVTFRLVGPDPSAVNALNSRSLIADAPPSPQRGPSPVRGGPAAPRVPTASGSPPHCPDAPSRPAARAAPPRRAVQVAVWTPRPQPLGQSAGASCAAVWPSSRSVSRRSPGSCIPTMSGPPICHWICWASTPSSWQSL